MVCDYCLPCSQFPCLPTVGNTFVVSPKWKKRFIYIWHLKHNCKDLQWECATTCSYRTFWNVSGPSSMYLLCWMVGKSKRLELNTHATELSLWILFPDIIEWGGLETSLGKTKKKLPGNLSVFQNKLQTYLKTRIRSSTQNINSWNLISSDYIYIFSW